MNGVKKRIAILALFRQFDDGYALSVGWLERARLLQYFNQDFDFYVQSNCKSDIYPNAKKVLPHPLEKEPFESKVAQYEKVFLEYLQDYDCILTADLMYQRKGNFLPANQAMRNVEPKLKAKWFHWVHSAYTNRLRSQYPESLRFTGMPNSTMVYMNNSEKKGLEQMYQIQSDEIACVYNPKDYRSFNRFVDDSWDICKRLDIPNKDIIQIFPHCSTRMTAKGIDPIIRTFEALKRKGKKVALIFANSHAKSMLRQLQQKKKGLGRIGLIEGEDYVFTHDIMFEKYGDYRALSQQAVADLFKVSNLFVFASWREVCPNVLLEAKINDNLLVVNEKVLPLVEFAGAGYNFETANGTEREGAIYFQATSKTPGVQDGVRGDMSNIIYKNEKEYYMRLAKEILRRIPSTKYMWEFSYEKIWQQQFQPLLYGGDK